MPVVNPAEVVQILVNRIKKIHRESGVQRAEVDVSGGLDSAVVLMTVARAVGPENVTAVYQGIDSSPDSLKRARDVAQAAGVKLVEFDGTDLFAMTVLTMCEALNKAGHDKKEILARINADPTILGSIRSTMRAPWGRAAGRITGNAIRHGTGNKCEDEIIRFFQKGGDGEVDTSFWSSLSKAEMYQLAIFLGVPQSILDARPSPDLWGEGETHNDEDEIKNFLQLRLPSPAYEELKMYSYVTPEGRYRNIGLIERVSTFASLVPSIFGDDEPDMDMLAKLFQASYAPKSFSLDFCRFVLKSFRRVEKITRHKSGAHLPTISRKDFGEALTDKFDSDLL